MSTYDSFFEQMAETLTPFMGRGFLKKDSEDDRIQRLEKCIKIVEAIQSFERQIEFIKEETSNYSENDIDTKERCIKKLELRYKTELSKLLKLTPCK